MGGEGKKLLNIDSELVEAYKHNKNRNDLARQFGICHKTVKQILIANNCVIEETYGLSIFCPELNIIFDNSKDAAESLIEAGYTTAKVESVKRKINEAAKNNTFYLNLQFIK